MACLSSVNWNGYYFYSSGGRGDLGKYKFWGLTAWLGLFLSASYDSAQAGFFDLSYWTIKSISLTFLFHGIESCI